mmetsp:Transcript_14283/g.23974  ORF Transcript_14283/g.23974 Transcript_14283/m.23974 type:complete len:423 (-) Transcript_14283:201-1469(-)
MTAAGVSSSAIHTTTTTGSPPLTSVAPGVVHVPLNQTDLSAPPPPPNSAVQRRRRRQQQQQIPRPSSESSMQASQPSLRQSSALLSSSTTTSSSSLSSSVSAATSTTTTTPLLMRGRFSYYEVWMWRGWYLVVLLSVLVKRSLINQQIEVFWQYLLDRGLAQLDSFEPIVASASFYMWIGMFKVVDLMFQQQFRRFKITPDHDPVKAEGGVFQFFSPIGSKDTPGFMALFAYLVPLFIFDLLVPRRTSRSYFNLPPPTIFQLMGNISMSIFVYDFLFYFPHLIMHRNRYLFKHVHSKHHSRERLCSVEVVRHSFIDGTLQVVANIVTLNLLGLDAFSRMVHNIVVTFLLTETHSGYDFPWAIHNILPEGVMGGAPAHEAHHRYGNVAYHQFFTYIDNYFGYYYYLAGSSNSSSWLSVETPKK